MNDSDSSMKAEAGGKIKDSQLQPNSTSTPTSMSSSMSSSGSPLSGKTASADDPGDDDGAPDPKTGWFQRVFSVGKKDATKIRKDLANVLAERNPAIDGFTLEEKTMLNNVLRLQHIRVEDVMTPRAELEAIDMDTGLGELLRAFEETGHSRLPVYVETLDDPRGMVHIRDIVAYITQTAHLSATEADARKQPLPADLDLKKVSLSKPLSELNLLREILFVPPSMLASDLMEKMQAARIQIALVIDEYGGTDGLVSLEDLVEVVVGDIEDEHDENDDALIVEEADGVFICDARAELEDIAERVGESFQIGEMGEDMDTIGGLIFAIIGRVPVRGEVIQAFGFEFRVIDADPRRIKKVEMERSRKQSRRSSP
jgi:CBS domain containing-hemolysin-like protein